MNFAILILTLSFSSSAALSVAPLSFAHNCLLNKTDFIPTEEELRKLSLPLSLMAASPQIEIQDANGKKIGACSSVFVSDDGNLLTAGHCVDTCVHDAMSMKEDKVVIDHEKLKHPACKLLINGEVMPLIVLAHDGCPIDRTRVYGGYKYCPKVDWAVLKTSGKLSLNSPCLETSNENPNFNRDLLSVGYPLTTTRARYLKGARDSREGQQYATIGRSIPWQNHCVLKADPDSNLKTGDQKFPFNVSKKQIQENVELGYMIQTTNDVQPGMSGSPLIDAKSGLLYGVLAVDIFSTPEQECPGSAIYSSASRLTYFARRDFPEYGDSLFRCQKHSISKSVLN